MKKIGFFLILFFFAIACITAQELYLLDIDFDDIDSLFGDPVAETPATTSPGTTTTPPPATTPPAAAPAPSTPRTAPAPVISTVRRRGITFNASYNFRGAINPGWDVHPWEFDGDEEFSWAIGIRMNSTFTITTQISEFFSVRTVINYNIPGGNFSFGNYFLDYNFFNKVFLRAGRFEQSWGISPNFHFTNLLSWVPTSRYSPSYIMRFEIPIGIGGIQALAMTRNNLASANFLNPNNTNNPDSDDIGYGGKYNLALRWADFDLGVFYYKTMPTRGFFSVKTTVWDIDLYNEWLVAVSTKYTDNDLDYLSFNFGFSKSFLDNNLELNGEFFYNRDKDSFFYHLETEFEAAGTRKFLEGVNIALNVLYRLPNGWGNPRFFARLRYSLTEESLMLIPGFRITPQSNFEIYFATPIALGDKDGYYYLNSKNTHGEIRPFSVLLYVSFRGSFAVTWR